MSGLEVGGWCGGGGGGKPELGGEGHVLPHCKRGIPFVVVVGDREGVGDMEMWL